MSYADITFKDKNPLKRWLQQRRLVSAITLYSGLSRSPATICDFGSGNGEFCKLLAERYPESIIACYEPTPSLLSEAKENLRAIAGIDFLHDIEPIAAETFDVVFCLEVFEHLPPQETAAALRTIYNILKPDGIVVIGVPVEIGIPALYKGLFRMFRRYGAFDANIKNIALAFLGYPPKNRPIAEITPGKRFHYEHMGFHFRRLQEMLSSYFRLLRISASPFAALGAWSMPEVYLLAKKTKE